MSNPQTADGEDAKKEAETTMDLPDTERHSADFESSVKKDSNGGVDETLEAANGNNPSLQTKMHKTQLCGVCNINESKYKCSSCYLPYCSIACSNVHKATHPTVKPKPAPEARAEPPPQATTTVPRPGTVAAAGFKSLFTALDESKDLQTLFRLYPGLPTVLDEINTATLPPIHGEKHQNIYSKGPRDRKEDNWTLDRGLRKGVEALNRARNTNGKDGEGVREYSKLILQLLSTDDGVSAAELVQKELAQENVRIIEQLLNGEMRS